MAANEGDSQITADASDARSNILSRLTPDRVLAEAISKDEFVPSERMRILKESAPRLGEQVLLQGLESPWEQMRKLCLEELTRRRRLPAEVAQKLVQDSSLFVRALALESLAEKGNLPGPQLVREALKDPEKESGKLFGTFGGLLGGERVEQPPDLDSIIVTFYGTQSVDDLLATVDWFSVDGPLAYKALALSHFDVIELTIRQDLEIGFKRIREESLRRIEKTSGPEAAKAYESGFEKFNRFTTSRFEEAALLGIAKNGMPDAGLIAKPYLASESSGLREAALEVVRQYGESDDTSDLLKIAREDYGETRKKAASAALKLSSKPLETVRELLLSDNADLVKVALSWMLSQDSYDLTDVFTTSIHDEDATFRIHALLGIFRKLQRSDLETTLESYIGSGTYFYDVVTWLDRLLYAPQPLKDAFVRKLEGEQTD